MPLREGEINNSIEFSVPLLCLYSIEMYKISPNERDTREAMDLCKRPKVVEAFINITTYKKMEDTNHVIRRENKTSDKPGKTPN